MASDSFHPASGVTATLGFTRYVRYISSYHWWFDVQSAAYACMPVFLLVFPLPFVAGPSYDIGTVPFFGYT